jgi:hypothetical protein
VTEQPLIGPQVRYPTPWRLAEQNGNNRVIVDAEGSWVGEIPSDELADLIVSLVNREADPGMVNMLEANDALQELAGQLAEAHAEIERLRTLGTGVVHLDLSQIPHTLRVSDVQRVFRAAGLRLQFDVDKATREAAAEGSQQ